jgi:hypothetical protein
MAAKRSIVILLAAIATAIAAVIVIVGKDAFDFLTWQPVPVKTGVIWNRSNVYGDSPFKINADKANYAMKVIDAASGAEVMLVYVAAGEAFSTRLPVGRYKIKAIHGPVWYGTKRLFGGDTHPIFLTGQQSSNSLYGYVPNLTPCVEAPPTVFDFTTEAGCAFKMLQGSQFGLQTGASFRDF